MTTIFYVVRYKGRRNYGIYIRQEEALQIATKNSSEWNIKTAKFFTMGLTVAGVAQICPDGFVPVMAVSGLSLASAMLSSAYMAHQNQKVISPLEKRPFQEVEHIIENVANLSVDSTISNIFKSIKAIREKSSFKPI